ncbi:sorting nexin-15 isoform X2 [Notamacropus eugenii]|uniref:sorting nexin-15 isoform X2 n=1 Tax=Notamacropus eugenii TaxID=9315 RepID=UPI003B66D3CD
MEGHRSQEERPRRALRRRRRGGARRRLDGRGGEGTAWKRRPVARPRRRSPADSGSSRMSLKAKDDYRRLYTVSDTRTHPKGYTEYKVTAQVVIWKRYSDFRRLHGDLAYTHRNLFRRLEEFPTFPRAQVFGRFEASVIEERRKAAEAMLRFTVNIPALNNSPQLKEFFRGGDVTRPLEPSDLHILPPPLVPTSPSEDAHLPQPLPAERLGREEPEDENERPGDQSPSSPAQEAFDLLFDCGAPEEETGPVARGPLTEAELALFDPFSKEGACPGPSPTHVADLAALGAEPQTRGQTPWEPGGGDGEEEEEGPHPAYLSRATELISQALKDERAGAYAAALQGYRDGVDVLLQGLPGDPNCARQEGVKRKVAEYLRRAEEILHLHLQP